MRNIGRKIDKSFGYYLENELKLNINDIWNWKKNKENGINNPFEISKGSSKKVWLYCLKKDYHNDNEGYEITCCNFCQRRRCPYCSGKKLHYKDSFGYKCNKLSTMIINDKRNDIMINDLYKISCNSKEKFFITCYSCGKPSGNKKTISNLYYQGFSCEYCSDGLPLTEKFVMNILRQLKINFISQLTKVNFEWCKNYEYDFYIPSLNAIMEINGIQHYQKSNRGRTLEDEQENDKCKKELALDNGIKKYIIIDCRYSEFDWLKENIIKELSSYFDLSNVNWELAWEESQNSLVIKAWELWEKGLTSYDISLVLNLSKQTIIKYLKKGSIINRCSYTYKEAYKRASLKRKKGDS